MIGQAINDFRIHSGARPVNYWDRPGDDYCAAHSRAMADRGALYHSEEHYRPGLGELVGYAKIVCAFDDTVKWIIWEQFGKSTEGHREALLGWQRVAYGYFVQDGVLYLTIRGC